MEAEDLYLKSARNSFALNGAEIKFYLELEHPMKNMETCTVDSI